MSLDGRKLMIIIVNHQPFFRPIVMERGFQMQTLFKEYNLLENHYRGNDPRMLGTQIFNVFNVMIVKRKDEV